MRLDHIVFKMSVSEFETLHRSLNKSVAVAAVKLCIHLLQGLNKNRISLWDNRVNFSFFTNHQFSFKHFKAAAPFI